MEKINVGFIGMGYISDFHIDALKRIGITEIAAATDINSKLAENNQLFILSPKYTNQQNNFLRMTK